MKASFDPAFKMRATASLEPSRYRRTRGQDPVATLLALLLVGGLVSAFVFMHPVFKKVEKRTPTVVTLLSLPDDPPPAEQPDPDPVTPPPVAQVVAPPPLVTLPVVPVMPVPVAATVAPLTPERAVAPPAPAPVARGPENAGEISARVISARPIVVPLESRRNQEEGTVVLSVMLGTDGRVSEISIARSSGFPRLDRAVLNAVRDWRWSPLVRDGSPVMVKGLVTIPIIRERRGRGGHDRRHGERDRDGEHQTT